MHSKSHLKCYALGLAYSDKNGRTSNITLTNVFIIFFRMIGIFHFLIILSIKDVYSYINIKLLLQVQALDVNTVTELNKRYPTECGSLLSSSPIVRFQIPNRKFAKPLTFTLPLPPNSTKMKRPQSVAPGSLSKDKGEHREQAAARPLSSIGFSTKEGRKITF